MSRFRSRDRVRHLCTSMIALIVALGGTADASSVANNSVGTSS